MIVVCTGCSAKFRVADEKVGPRGARLRCSKCQTVFIVQRPLEPPPAFSPAATADPFLVAAAPPPPPPPPRAMPPPLPRRATTLDARAAFEVDLEPHLGSSPAPADPFAGFPPEPFGEALSPPAPVVPTSDPFADPAGGAEEPPPPTPPPAAASSLLDLDPFAPSAPAALGPEVDFSGPARARVALPSDLGGSGSLSLEEATTPPARRLARSPASEPEPMPVLGAAEDPFASTAPLDPGLSALDEGMLAPVTAPAGEATHGVPAPWPVAGPETPLQLDPFGAAAVASDPLAVDEPSRRTVAPPAPEALATGRPVAGQAFRIREVLVSAMALAALLLLSLAILVVWRGGLAPADALRPSAILAALSPRPPAGTLLASDVTSGLYERARGAPLLFVRGRVVSTSPVALERVRVVVEVVRDGALLARGEVPVGAVPGPEALFDAADAGAVERALAEAAPPDAGRLAANGSAPFLIAFAEYPANLGGASLRVVPVAGPAR
jgi:predicted Zn finger-like uncharacterized protein